VIRPSFGIGLRGNLALPEYARLGRLAEDLGFDVVSAFHDLGDQPALVPLLEVAKVTERVAVGPACLNPYTMRPDEIAAAIASLDEASGGRAYLGLAKGAWLDTIGVAQPDPVTRVREAATFVTSRFRVPLLIGGWGPRMVALAGEIAGELKVGGSANPAIVPVMRRRLAVGAARAGRDAYATGIVLGAVTVVDTDRAAARSLARAAVASYYEVVARFDPTVAVSTDVEISDEILDRFAFAGTPEEVARHVDDVFAAGASRVEFGAPFGLEPAAGLQLLAQCVLGRGE
jgi:5,10-methylenetetrahydromethanopterin reductase